MKVLRMIVAVATALATNVVLAQQPTRVVFNDLFYLWPAAQGAADTFLKNDGAGNLSWSGPVVPAGMLAFTKAGSCPSGWAEYTPARGRYVVGLPGSGTNLATVGTALSNQENRPAGQHNHPGSSLSVSLTGDVGHGHGTTDPQHRHSGAPAVGSNVLAGAASHSFNVSSGWTSFTQIYAPGTFTNFGTSGISVSGTPTTTLSNPTGSVAGTNAPYVQYLLCEKV